MTVDNSRIIVYGIDVEKTNADELDYMTEQERYDKFVCGHVNELEKYSFERFFYNLNSGLIDTENKFWFIARA